LTPALLAATDRLAGAVAAAAETGALRIEPSHLLIALGRVPRSEAARGFADSGIPVAVFVEALRGTGDRPDGPPPTALTEASASDATREVFQVLEPGSGERELLASVLARLEPSAVELLSTYGQLDLGRWIADLSAAPEPPPDIFGADDLLTPEAFSSGARRVITTMATDAGALGHSRLTTVLLLHAMAVVPNGLVEQACHFLRHDPGALRAQIMALTGAAGRPVPAVPLTRDAVQKPLGRAFETAARSAARRHGARIAERDLLTALLDIPGSLALEIFRSAEVDTARLRRFAESYYQEAAVEESEAPKQSALPPDEALVWIRERLVGREKAVDRLEPHLETITRSMRRGLRLREQPRGTFLFCGPSGTGKTMTARVLARVLFGSEEDVLVFEMGQFNTKESINNFIGAPPGYVGYGSGKLTDGLRDNPRRVLLFDEVEKADSRVLDALLRLLDEGRINDPSGPVRDARESVVVLTSNIGAFSSVRSESAHGPRAASSLRHVMRDFFRPEFLNRIDEVILFEPFDGAQLAAIAQAGLRRQAADLREQLDVEVTWAQEVPSRVADLALTWRRDEAARGVNRFVDSIVPPLLRLMDESEAQGGRIARVRVVVEDSHLSVVDDHD
jgi:ATP-dependent Clp protease ATP-binding subunit ClpC